MTYHPPGWSPIEARILKASIQGRSGLVKQLRAKVQKCRYCGSSWEQGKREYHRENCTL